MAKDHEVSDSDKKFARSFYNSISLGGAFLALTAFVLIIFLSAMDILSAKPMPYLGILTYIILPIFLIIGLVLIPIGMERERRRRTRGLGAQVLPRVDLNDPRHRRSVVVFLASTAIFVFATAIGTYKVYDFTETVTFCGELCHKVMEPEFVAYQNSPHARVKCVECHVGAGATWYVRSKLSGAYQVYSTLFNKYPRPIPTPITNLRPARETCEECHWPRAFFGSKQTERVHYRKDEKNSLWYYNMLIKIGGGTPELGHTSGIHWHMNIDNKIEYLATDKTREEIVWVRSTSMDGKVSVYSSDPDFLDGSKIDSSRIRVMDCVDCHNRPTHIYHSPNIALNRAMSDGRIDSDLPYIKFIAAEALTEKYPDRETAVAAIDSTIRAYYQSDYPEILVSMAPQIDLAIETAKKIYVNNNFPSMNASWRDYPNHIGHFLSAGCYRCHDGMHENAEGDTITKDCNACHLIIEQGDRETVHEVNLEGLEFRHPEDIDEAWKEMSCHECHGTDEE